MSDLILEPFATYVYFKFATNQSKEKWKKILMQFIETLVSRCDDAGPSVIGHIKALALFPEKRYLRVSAVSSAHPPEVEGNPPDSFSEMKLTLNLLVYGLNKNLLQRITQESISDQNLSIDGNISLSPIGQMDIKIITAWEMISGN